jgi:hypothetical protein
MDHPRDSGWIEPLEATTLSADEEKAATPILVPINKGDKSEPDQDVTFNSISAGGRAGAPKWGVEGGVVRLPPERLRPQSFIIVCPQNL